MKNRQTNSKFIWDPDVYNRNNKLQYDFALKMLNKYKFRGNESVLDVGSGSGNITVEIAKQVPQGQVIGLDSSQEMTNYAQNQYQYCANLSFVCARAEDFDFKEKFDLITSFTVFHWIEAQEDALNNCLIHLKPNGLFLLGLTVPIYVDTALNQCCLKLIDEKWHKELGDFEVPFYISNVTMFDYKKILKKVGYKIISFDYTMTKFTFNNHQSLANWFFSWIPYRNALSDEDAHQFFLELAQEYTSFTNNYSNKIVYYEYCAWEILLKR
jgi:trans-aconitate 2-methyltransferase